MRFQFTINQLLNADESYKSMPNIEKRALIYQKILLESEMVEKLKLLKKLKKDLKRIKNIFFQKRYHFLESIKSDGIKIDQKYDNLYEIDNT